MNLTLPIFSKLLFLYVIFYLFAIVGQKLYGGLITVESVRKLSPETPALYYLLNFNNYPSSLVTLFHFMVINNWYVTIDMYQDVLGHEMGP